MSHKLWVIPLWFLIGQYYFKKPFSDIKGISEAKVSQIFKIILSDWSVILIGHQILYSDWSILGRENKRGCEENDSEWWIYHWNGIFKSTTSNFQGLKLLSGASDSL